MVDDSTNLLSIDADLLVRNAVKRLAKERLDGIVVFSTATSELISSH